MRLLLKQDLGFVFGADGQCTTENSNRVQYVEVPNVKTGQNLTPVYEAIVAATSLMIERVANAFN